MIKGVVNIDYIRIIESFFKQLGEETRKGVTGDNGRILMELTGMGEVDLLDSFAKSIISSIVSKCQEIIKSWENREVFDINEKKYAEVSELANKLGIADIGNLLETLKKTEKKK